MKASTYGKIINFINIILIYLIIMAIFMTIQSRYKELTGDIIFTASVAGSVIILFYLIRQAVDKFYLFMLLHILPCICIVTLMSGETFRVISYSAIVIISAIVSIFLRYSKEKQTPKSMGFAPVIFIFVCHMFSNLDDNMIKNYLGILTFFFMLLVVLNSYLTNRYIFMISYDQIICDMKKVCTSSSSFFGGFIAILAIICIQASIFTGDNIVLLIRNILYKTAYFVANLIASNNNSYSIAEPEPTNPPVKLTTTVVNETIKDTKRHFDIPVWVMYLVIIISVLIFIVLVVYFAYKLFKQVNDENDDKIEFISPFTKVKSDKPTKVKKTVNTFENKNINKKIRRIFKKTIEGSMNAFEKVDSSHTPTQLCASTENFPSNSADYLTLKDIYEKARYSNTECSKEDLKKANNINLSIKEAKND